MILNPKIIKVNTAIEKTKEQIAEHQAKLRDLEKQKTQLENDEIVAMFRRERLNEDEFAALLQSGRQKSPQQQSPPQQLQQHSPKPSETRQEIPGNRKEDEVNDNSEA